MHNSNQVKNVRKSRVTWKKIVYFLLEAHVYRLLCQYLGKHSKSNFLGKEDEKSHYEVVSITAACQTYLWNSGVFED